MAIASHPPTRISTHLRSKVGEEWLFDEPDYRFGAGALIAGPAANDPALAVGRDNSTWFVWSETDRASGDSIQLASYTDAKFEGPVQVSAQVGFEFQPAIAVESARCVWVAWSAWRDARWQIKLRQFQDGASTPEQTVAENSAGAFNPSLVLTQAGDLYVAWEQIEDKHGRIALRVLKKDGDWSEQTLLTDPAVHCFRPVLAETKSGDVYIAYDRFDTNYHIYLQKIGPQLGSPVRVTDGDFQHYQPALSAHPDGSLWISWASNESESRDDPWHLPRWLYASRWDGKQFSVPLGPQHGKDLNRIDFFQGWEFPAITVDQGGRVWLFGQSAHTLYAQFYSDHEWSGLLNFSERKWGTWKPRCRAGLGPDGNIRLIAMGLQGLQFHLIQATKRSLHSPQVIAPTTGRKLPPSEPSSGRYPAIQDSQGTEFKVFFGDIHAHSVRSDAIGDVDEFYLRAKYGFQDDLAALTDHDYLDLLELSPSTFKWMCNLAARFNQQGQFVTMSAWEWTAPAVAVHAKPGQRVGEGHKNVYFPGDDGVVYSYGDPQSDTGAKLIANFKGQRVLVIPHHIGWSGCYWDYHDPELQRLVEICSTHGRYEYEGNRPIGYRPDQVYPGNFILDVLKTGLRLGFTGGSDGHGLLWHGTYPEKIYGKAQAGSKVGWKENPFRTGLTAVLASEQSRPAIFDALWNRRCYATSGAKIFMDFRVNSQLMGSDLVSAEYPKIQVRVIGTAALDTVEILRNGTVISAGHWQGSHPIREISLNLLDDLLTEEQEYFYYLRVLQQDGEMAWSSPIWVRFHPAK